MFVCKSIKLANFLINHGSIIYKIDKDKSNNNFVVFLFKKDTLLKENLDLWEKTK